MRRTGAGCAAAGERRSTPRTGPAVRTGCCARSSPARMPTGCLRSPWFMPASPDLFRALGALCEPPDRAHARLAAALGLPPPADAASFTDVFVFQLVPYAAPYLSPEGMLGGEAGDRVAGFWRALHLTPPAEPDHLAALLGLYATLGEAEDGERDPARQALWRQARRALLWEHLLTWAVAYARAVAASARPAHAAWAELLERTLLASPRAARTPARWSASCWRRCGAA